MIIRYHKRFDKRLKKLPDHIGAKVKVTMKNFTQHPTNPRLHNHALKGNMQGRRAISVTSNLRIIFREENNYALVIMLDIGTHNQVY